MANEKALVPIDQQAGDFLRKYQPSIAGYAMRNYDVSAFLKSAKIAIMSNNDLQKCLSTGPGQLSLFSALSRAATNGLSLNPQEGKAALIPYGGEIRYQIMKNGMIDLALESGKVEYITCDVVRENDEWQFPRNPSENYTYQPARKERGDIDGFFAAMKLKEGSLLVKYMTTDEVKDHRQKYSAKTAMPEIGYGLKTAMKALLRGVSISPELTAAIEADDYYEEPEKAGTTADELVVEMKTAEKQPEKTEDVQGDLI